MKDVISNTFDELDFLISEIEKVDLDKWDREILVHVKNKPHGFWFITSRIQLLRILCKKYGINPVFDPNNKNNKLFNKLKKV